MTATHLLAFLSFAKMNPTTSRYVTDFYISTKYYPGRENIDAEWVSRMVENIAILMQDCKIAL